MSDPLPITKDTSTRIDDRVMAAFSDASVLGYVIEYLETLRDNQRQLGTDIKQAALLLLLLVVIFELITRAAVAEVTLGVFKVSDVTLIYRAIPAIVAYLCHNLMFLMILRKKTETVHDSIIKKVYEPIYNNNLFAYLTPHYGSLTNDNYLADNNSKSGSFLSALSLITGGILILTLLGFQIYAFYHLFVKFTTSNVFVWLSLVVSLMFLIRALIVINLPADQ